MARNETRSTWMQCVTRPKIWTIPIPRLFFGTKFFRDRFRDFFLVPNFFETDSETFFGTKFFRDRFRDFFRYQIFFETGSDTIKKIQKSRERDETRTQINTNILKNFETGSDIFFWYQTFSRPIPRLFSVPNFFETGSKTFFGTKIFSRPVPRLFSVPNFFDSGSDTIKKNTEFPGTGIPGTGTSHSVSDAYNLWI